MQMKNYVAAFSLAEAADWQVAASEKSYLLVKRLLGSFAGSMQKALQQENASYRTRVDAENTRYEKELAELRREYLDGPNRVAEDECRRVLNRYTQEQTTTVTNLGKRLNGAEIRFKDDNLIQKIVTSIIRRQDESTLNQIEAGKRALEATGTKATDALNMLANAAGKVRDAKARLNNRLFDQRKDAATEEHHLKLENIENEHRNTVSQIIGAYEEEFSRYFNTATFTTAYDMVGTRMRSAIGYSCSDKVPDALYLGVRSFTITNGNDTFIPEVVNLFRRIEHKAVSATGHEIRIELPFFRSLEEGYSVYLEVDDAAVGTSNKVVWGYVMKVLMNFPAGQTRPLLLDCDSTTELTDFKAIGDSSGRNMVTKPWTKQEDIETELSKLATEHSNLTISYGKDVASRMLREPVYVVACRNFPKNITPAAMSAMSTIISAGAARGFFGIIQASNREMAARANDTNFNTLLETIKKSSLYVRETADGYVIAQADGADRFTFEPLNAVEENKREILSHLIDGVASYRRQVEKFEYLFSKDAGNIEGMDMHNINTWYRGDASSRMEVPIGISGASTVQKYTISGVAQHGLISGVTGSGKSTLLKNIIVASMMKYTPDNLNLYLIDFKEGVEFTVFSEYPLPWIKTIALNTQRVFALNILQQLELEFKRRADTMRREAINHIREAKEKYPRILLIFDEVQELLSVNDDITRQCISILSSLVSEGRAMNINVIMSSLNFAVCHGIDTLKANMVLRIAMKGTPESVKIVMGEDFDVALLEQGDVGTAAINTASGARGQTSFFQAGYMDDDEMKDLLSKLAMCMRARKADTRIMAIHANQDRNSKFNRLITDGEVSYSEDAAEYELMLGDEFVINRRRKITLAPEQGENLLLVGPSEETAKSVFALSVLSVLYGELASRANQVENELVRLVDMSDDCAKDADYLKLLSDKFPRQVNRVTGRQVRAMIDDTHRVLTERKRGQADKSERLFLMLFGVDSMDCLKQEMLSEDDGELSTNKKLLQLLQQGPENGINCILWSRSVEDFRGIVDSVNMSRNFNKRLYFGPDEFTREVLGMAFEDMKSMTEKTVAYRDMSKPTPNAFRVFELPHPEWVESIAEAYKSFQHK